MSLLDLGPSGLLLGFLYASHHNTASHIRLRFHISVVKTELGKGWCSCFNTWQFIYLFTYLLTYLLNLMNNFYLIFVELSATAYGRDIIHIYLLYMFHGVTVIILFCKHWGFHSAFNFLNIWRYVL